MRRSHYLLWLALLSGLCLMPAEQVRADGERLASINASVHLLDDAAVEELELDSDDVMVLEAGRAHPFVLALRAHYQGSWFAERMTLTRDGKDSGQLFRRSLLPPLTEGHATQWHRAAHSIDASLRSQTHWIARESDDGRLALAVTVRVPASEVEQAGLDEHDVNANHSNEIEVTEIAIRTALKQGQAAVVELPFAWQQIRPEVHDDWAIEKLDRMNDKRIFLLIR